MSPTARKRLGLATKPPANKRQRIPKIEPELALDYVPTLEQLTHNERLMFDTLASFTQRSSPEPYTLLEFTRVMLRGAAREYDADSEAHGLEAVSLERAALRYAYELLASEDQRSGNYSEARDMLDRYARTLAEALTRLE